jgi:hypothetical protein
VQVRTSIITALLFVWAQPLLPAQSQTPPQPTVTLQAELLKTIEANHAKVGDEITARTATAIEIIWIKCPVGALVLGHITKV